MDEDYWGNINSFVFGDLGMLVRNQSEMQKIQKNVDLHRIYTNNECTSVVTNV